MTFSSLPAAILLDQDGTIVDTEPVWDEVEYRITEELGGVLTPEMRQTFIGGPISYTAQCILEISGSDMAREALEYAIIEGVATTIEKRGVRWLPGVSDFLRRMKTLNLPVAVVTASVHRISDAILADAPVDAIRFMVAGDDVTDPKPAPDGYQLAAQRLGFAPQDCIAIEDSTPGMTAAVSAGARTIIVPGHQRVELLEGVCRVSSINDINEDLLRRVMAGEVFDMLN